MELRFDELTKKVLIGISVALVILGLVIGLDLYFSKQSQKGDFEFEGLPTKQTRIEKIVDQVRDLFENEYQEENKEPVALTGGSQVVQQDSEQTRAVFNQIQDNKIYLRGIGGEELSGIQLTEKTGYQCQNRYFKSNEQTVDASKIFINLSKASLSDVDEAYIGSSGLQKLLYYVSSNSVLTVTLNKDNTAKIVFIMLDNCREFYE